METKIHRQHRGKRTVKTQRDYWATWYAKPEVKEKRKAYCREWKRRLRRLLIERKGGKCEICGTTKHLEIHEINGNPDKHSSKRFTEMRDGKRPYQVLCEKHHADTNNWKRKRVS